MYKEKRCPYCKENLTQDLEVFIADETQVVASGGLLGGGWASQIGRRGSVYTHEKDVSQVTCDKCGKNFKVTLI